MFIFKKLREKAASSISSFEQAEDFLWNRWLRVPSVVEEEIGSINSKLDTNEKLLRRIPGPALFGFEFLLARGRVYRLRNKSFSLKTKVIRIFFGLGETYVENYMSRLFAETEILFSEEIMSEGSSRYSASKAASSASSAQRINTDITTIDFLDSVRDDPRKYWCSSDSTSYDGPRSDVTGFEGKRISADFPITRSDYYDPFIEHPDTTDMLKPMYPAVYRIKLLELNPEDKEIPIKINLLDQHPTVELLPGNDFGVVLKMTEYFSGFDSRGATATFSFPDKLFIKGTSINRYEINTVLPQTVKQEINKLCLAGEVKTSDVNSADILNSLQPEVKLSDKERSIIFAQLSEYQIKAVEYLTENRRALLTGKPGVGKSVEAAAALRYLFRKKEIKSALIISDEIFISSAEISRATGCATGWEAVIDKFAPELSDSVAVRDTDRGSDRESVNKIIQIYSIEMFFEKLAGKMTSASGRLKYDCIIIDEIQLLSKYKQRLKVLFEKAEINYLWLITSLKSETARNILNNTVLPETEFESTNKMGINNTMDIIRQNFWTAVDKDQKMEYDISLFDGKNGIIDIYKTGNPYRLQSKILMVLHSLNQVCNFYSDKDESPKSRLLLHHLDSISSRNKKTVVFTQYDKQGVSKIASILARENINFVIFKRGMNNAEIREVEDKFTKDDSVSVLIADSHASGIRFSNLKTDYIVHFDRWWIPAAQWQIDREIIAARRESREPLVIYNYLTKNLIEEKIIRMLYSKGLLEPAIFDTYGIDKFNRLVTGEEWLKLFDLAVEQKTEEQEAETPDKSGELKKLTHEERIKLIAKFFNVLGYDMIKIFKSDECSCCRKLEATFNSKGIEFEIAAVVNLSFNGIDSKGMLKLLENVSEDEKYHRVFLITLTDFPYDSEKLKFEDIIYIPLKRLAEYLAMLDLI